MRNEILKVEIVSVAPRLPQNDDPNGGKKGSPFWRKIAEICIPVGTIGLLLVNIPLSCYTKKSADAAYNGIELARKNARMDQRAWVAISDIPPPNFQKNSNWSVSLILKNTGKTPAKNFVIRATGDAVGKGQKPSAQEITLPGHGIIAPDGVFHSNLNISGRYDWKSSDLVIHGTIDYDSVFGCSHWTKFCYYFVPNESGKGGGFAPCDSGNDIDNNPP